MHSAIYVNHKCNIVNSGCNLTVPGNFSGTPSVRVGIVVFPAFLTADSSHIQVVDLPMQTIQVVPSQTGAEPLTDPSLTHSMEAYMQ